MSVCDLCQCNRCCDTCTKKECEGGNTLSNSNPTQSERILDYLRNHDGITQFEALQELGIMRLASRVSDLRKHGYAIESKMVTVKNRYGEKCSVKRYSLKEE